MPTRMLSPSQTFFKSLIKDSKRPLSPRGQYRAGSRLVCSITELIAYLGSSPRVLDSVAAEHLLTGSIECAATALAATLIVAAGPRHEQQGSIPEPPRADEPQNAGVEESCLRPPPRHRTSAKTRQAAAQPV